MYESEEEESMVPEKVEDEGPQVAALQKIIDIVGELMDEERSEEEPMPEAGEAKIEIKKL